MAEKMRGKGLLMKTKMDFEHNADRHAQLLGL